MNRADFGRLSQLLKATVTKEQNSEKKPKAPSKSSYKAPKAQVPYEIKREEKVLAEVLNWGGVREPKKQGAKYQFTEKTIVEWGGIPYKIIGRDGSYFLGRRRDNPGGHTPRRSPFDYNDLVEAYEHSKKTKPNVRMK